MNESTVTFRYTAHGYRRQAIASWLIFGESEDHGVCRRGQSLPRCESPGVTRRSGIEVWGIVMDIRDEELAELQALTAVESDLSSVVEFVPTSRNSKYATL